MEEYREREGAEETEGEDEEMGEHGPWMQHGMHHGGKGGHWQKCGCPMCRSMQAMHRMGMLGGMMPGMWMRGMGMPGMMDMAPWRKFVSSDERIAWLEKYLKDLQMEEKAVQERIDRIRSKYQKDEKERSPPHPA